MVLSSRILLCRIIVTLVALGGPAAAGAQTSVEVRLDNDYFNLWDGFWDRPDYDYTHGTKINATWASRDQPARTIRLELGQLIFNPSLSFFNRRNRPYAGWLYASAVVTEVGGFSRSSFGGYVGVSGSASLAEEAQRRFHEFAGRERNPTWRPVLRDEVGIGLIGRVGWQAPILEAGPSFVSAGLDLSGDLGTIRTEAAIAPSVEAGLSWSGLELRARASSMIRVRIHDSFVEGSMLSGPDYAILEPILREEVLEVGLRAGSVTLRYHVTRKGREYKSQLNPHTYSGFSLGVGMAADHWLPNYFRTWRP